MGQEKTREPEALDEIAIEPISDDALEAVAGGTDRIGTGPGTSDGPTCCSLNGCSWQE